MAEVIKVENLVKKYKEIVALEHLTLSVNEGEGTCMHFVIRKYEDIPEENEQI